MKKMIMRNLLALMSFFCLSCNSDGNDIKLSNLFYDSTSNTLFIANFESGRNVQRIDVDLIQDTLYLSIKKRTTMGNNKMRELAFNKIKIKLVSHIEYVKLGEKIIKKSDLKHPQKEILESYYPAFEVLGEKFPFTIN